MARCNSGDMRAMHALLTRDLNWVRQCVHRKLSGAARRMADTSDVVQDIMVSLLARGPRFSIADPHQFRKLMATVVLRRLQSLGRKAHARKRDVARENSVTSDTVLYLDGVRPVDTVTRPDQHAAQAEERALLSLALEMLEPDDADVVRLREWDQLEFQAIGQELGVAPDAARMRYRRAVQKLACLMARLRAGQVDEALRDAEGESSEE